MRPTFRFLASALALGYVLSTPATFAQTPATDALLAQGMQLAAGADHVREQLPSMGSEDFGAFGANQTPTAFWFLHASPNGDQRGAPNHSPEFMIDEAALRVGVRAMTGAALAQLTAAPAQATPSP